MDPAPGAYWQVPYLPIDPQDIGRTYKAIIRINSQSGKGGVAFIMEREFGLELPKRMSPEFSAVINTIADEGSKELQPEEIREAFYKEYLNLSIPLSLDSYKISTPADDHRHIKFSAEIVYRGKSKSIEGKCNGPIAAFVDGLDQAGLKGFHLTDFRQHAITKGSAAEAIAYIEIQMEKSQQFFWGASIDGNIELAGLKALVSARNRAWAAETPDIETAASPAAKATTTGAGITGR